MAAAHGVGADFLARYKAISAKLKKRFLRKPNVSEASEQFSQLAKQLQDEENTKYAAFTYVALARCEQSVGNPSGETQALLQAARLYLKEESENYQLKCPTYNEHLNSAISCYHNVIRVHLEQKNTSLAASVSLELANALKRLGRTSDSIGYYLQTAELLTQSPAECLSVLDQLATCLIETEDYDRALALLSDMSQMIASPGSEASSSSSNTRLECFGVFADMSSKIEILRVLLLLLLRPGPQRLSAEHSLLLEKYAWESNDFDASASLLGDNLFLLLQSFVMAHQSSDLDAMIHLQTDLWRYLTGQQNNLVHLIVDGFRNPEESQVR